MRQQAIQFYYKKIFILMTLILSMWLATEWISFFIAPYLIKSNMLFSLGLKLRYSLLLSGIIIMLLSCCHCYLQKFKVTAFSITTFLLGLFILLIAMLPFYSPLGYLIWLFKLPNAGMNAAWWLGVVILISPPVAVTIFHLRSLERNNLKKESDLFGSSRFATKEEIENIKLINNEDPCAIYLGGWQESKDTPIHYLKYSGKSNTAVIAPTRSGKGTGIIVPNLLSYQGTAIILDLKLENYYLTAGYRKSIGHTILKLDYTCVDGSGASFNPLLEIRKGINEIKDVQNIVDMIADPKGSGRSDHWTESANDLLVSVIIHVLYVEKDKSLTGVRKFISSIQFNKEEDLFKYMLNTTHDPDGIYGWTDPITHQPTRTHPLVASGAKDMLKKGEGEQTGIVSTLKRFLKLYRDPVIALNSSTSDFKISDLKDPNKKISLYIHVPPSDKDRLKPLLRIIFNLIFSRLTETWLPIDQLEKTTPILLILDEFIQLGYMEIFETALAYSVGYGLRTMLICQDVPQINKVYGKDESITSQCEITAIYAPNKKETAHYYSDMLGHQTIIQEKTNYSGHQTNAILSHINTSESEYKRPLMTHDEIMRLNFDEMILYKTNFYPIKGRKVMYWNDPVFKARSEQPAPEKSDKIQVDHDWTYSQEYKRFDDILSIENDDDIISDDFNLL